MPKRILVADDDPVILQLIQINLEMEGYQVVTAKDGVEAVNAAVSQTPDLVLLDIMMPNMDGWSAHEEIKKHKELAGIPVVFLSARAQTSDLQRGFQAGIADYITKPFDPSDLLETVARLVGRADEKPE